MNGETTKAEGGEAYAQTGHSELVEDLRASCECYDIRREGKCAPCRAADALTAADAEIARLTRERDEAQAKERERCAKIAETLDEGDRQTAAFIHAQNIATAIRSDQWQLMGEKP